MGYRNARRCYLPKANLVYCISLFSIIHLLTNNSYVESAPPRSRPRTTPPTRRPSPQQTFEAVQKLREANKALEDEEEQKLQLKDSVDARLQAWRTNKETNVRALLASLEIVLWPELGWQKVGMHELVSPGQVKVRYTRAIAKLHPDKVNTSF